MACSHERDPPPRESCLRCGGGRVGGSLQRHQRNHSLLLDPFLHIPDDCQWLNKYMKDDDYMCVPITTRMVSVEGNTVVVVIG